MARRALSTTLLLVGALASRPAAADSSPEDRAAADALYTEAGEAMNRGDHAAACPKLEASFKLDPGIGTLLRLGFCYGNLGKTASEWAAFNDAEAMARRLNDKRASVAAEQAKRIEPKLSRLVLDVAPESRAEGVEVRRDGRVIDMGAWGTPVPVDPGEHKIEASKMGKQTWTSTIVIEAKPGLTTVRVPALAEVAAPPPPVDAKPLWGAQRISGVVLGGVGAGLLVTSAAFTGRASTKNSASKEHCLPSAPDVCYREGVALREEASSAARVATGTLIAGGVAIAAGLVVFLTAPREARKVASTRLVPIAGGFAW